MPHIEGQGNESLSALLVRTANCLTAFLQAPTAQEGLNESRYNVLNFLRRAPSGTCSQTELATHLLQSESNLSTLLDRMRADGLISRVRSESDRRKTQVGLSVAGREALTRAEQARSRAATTILKILDNRSAASLCQNLERLLQRLELALRIGGRAPAGFRADRMSRRANGDELQDCNGDGQEEMVGPGAWMRGTSETTAPQPCACAVPGPCATSPSITDGLRP